jgi:WD40 repeat protein
VLATTSIDSAIYVWDTRDPKKPLKLRTLNAHASTNQVRWNRINPNTLASAQAGEVRIWDIRVLLSLLSHHCCSCCFHTPASDQSEPKAT